MGGAPDIIGTRRENLVNMRKQVGAYLPRELSGLAKAAGELAAARGEKLYLVGGAVRDLFLGRRNLDLDLVVEGDAPSLARQFAKGKGGKVITHARFGTATVTLGDVSLDMVTARSETYAEPGALPSVKPGTIKDDLFRRDFTVNAMAVSLEPASFGELVDHYGGKSDLDKGLIRILHKASFRDDPTRIWRAVRYEKRLGFRIESETERLLRRDLAMMDKVSGDRLRHELERILEEDSPEKALRRADELGALRQLHESLKADGWLVKRFEEARKSNDGSKPEPSLYLALLVWRLKEEELETVMGRLKFGGEAARVLRGMPNIKRAMYELGSAGIMPSEIYRLLEHHQPQGIRAAALATDSGLVRVSLELYLFDLRFVVPVLTGDELKRMGVPEGRRLGWMLRTLRNAKLDGEVTTREAEEALVWQWLSKGKS